IHHVIFFRGSRGSGGRWGGRSLSRGGRSRRGRTSAGIRGIGNGIGRSGGCGVGGRGYRRKICGDRSDLRGEVFETEADHLDIPGGIAVLETFQILLSLEVLGQRLGGLAVFIQGIGLLDGVVNRYILVIWTIGTSGGSKQQEG